MKNGFKSAKIWFFWPISFSTKNTLVFLIMVNRLWPQNEGIVVVPPIHGISGAIIEADLKLAGLFD
ncbi:hypothetical protein KFZ76_22270 [Methylovulum psychrotolerans]|jgi:hypothetical protein|uniref:hypothetical protein n=1 Tax=Methylovulum psychrotolerans TaxID=1704499 RepID=UPI001BFEF8FB|nr:hypothetical protein [Methylovulum psychrotolerans]MBT9100427.1 hypothetical protein [Methylovulum psychrotolerans]